MRKSLRIVAAFVGGFILGNLFVMPIGLIIDKIYGSEVTGGAYPLNFPNIIYAISMGFLSGYFAGYTAGRKGMLIGGILQFIPLIIMTGIGISINRDIIQSYYERTGVDLALWAWISLIPGIAGGFCGQKYGNLILRFISISITVIAMPFVWIGGVALHLYTVYIAYNASGIFAAIIAIMLPILSQIY